MTIKDPHQQRESKNYANPVASRELLIELIEKSPNPPTFNVIIKQLKYTDAEQITAVKHRLRAMENSGQVTFNKFKQYAIPNKSQILTGKIIGHRDGFGFFAPDPKPNEPKPLKDLYISAFEMQRVFHGDIVEAIEIDRADRKGRKEVKIIDVIEPRKAPVVGRFYIDQLVAFVVPEDSKIQQQILIKPEHKLGARQGQMVVVNVTQRGNRRSKAAGEIIEVLGDHMAPGMEIEVALREHDLPHQWSAQLLSELKEIDETVQESAKEHRVDLRDLPLVTIDGEDARDFDDAVYCQPEPSGGWRLWVAIADVSYYVRPDTALDGEAISRGNSVYFPSQVIPMLPEKLSNGLCSLNPDVDRLCMVCEMTISAAGELNDSTFYTAVMRSKARFTYTKVAEILLGDEALRAEYEPLVPHLEHLNDMYLALTDARKKRGAIAFETEESIFIFNDDKKIETIEPLIRNEAHKIIEECMILANVSTAKFIEKHKKPGLFRVHDKPSEDKYNNFMSYLCELGLSISVLHEDKEQPEPSDYGAILAAVKGRPDQELIQTMLLRSMKQAVYQSDNLGHFGLALPSYSHFTSPIRRYPDLVVHRVIKAILYAEQVKKAEENYQSDSKEKHEKIAAIESSLVGHFQYTPEAVIELGEHCSMTERRADDATRDVSDWLKCEFMQDHVGDLFEGVISTVTNFGMFVRLSKLHIEGLIHISSLGKDFYQFDEVRMCLVGERTKVKYKVGDSLEVKVAAVNIDEKKIDLMLADGTYSGGSHANKTASKGSSRKPSSNKSPSFDKPGEAKDNKGRRSSTDKKGPKKVRSKVKAKGSISAKAGKAKAKKSRPGKNARKKSRT